MMHLSYAQNMEDYHLELIFAGVDDGAYVDVGAGHPVADNVSFHFYLKGWRGLVVEPQEALARLYAHVRPRDHAVACLAGSAAAEIDFYVVDKLHGFSSTVHANAQGAGQFGASYHTIRKPVQPLSALIDAAGLTGIDFLKIDVEGAEGEVLAGLDFGRHRPRVLLIEAVAPGSMAEAWGEWEPVLLGNGYHFAFFDRLNRFYVAEEAKPLLARFPKEPARWDGVQHLWDLGRAPLRPDHPDHELAQLLLHGFLAELPALAPEVLATLLARGLSATGKGDLTGPGLAALIAGAARPGGAARQDPELAALLNSDAFRAALGRIASTYDGGHLMD
ncbi:MAG TPA: FkbM family methyltransferase [Hyphomicrobiaceae bacterium]|jgi:FkbM family methyltransferase|nr:FkbM family methyltransferase [Hyphomicrobiaceae bacterium]